MEVIDFDLAATLESGQFFRFYKKNGWYFCHAKNNFFKIKQEENKLVFDGSDKKFIANFFGLQHDLQSITESFTHDPYIKQAVQQNQGLRIIKQDLWECIVAFVLSSNSNIKRIAQNIEELSCLGDKRKHEKETSHDFPRPGKFDDLKFLQEAGTGYRAKYLYEINKILDEKWLEELQEFEHKKAKEKLMSLPGIGPKVADCICLFGLGHMQAFPIDVWIKRAMQQIYFAGTETDDKKIKEFAKYHFGEYAGYAQQYLYHHTRNKTL